MPPTTPRIPSDLVHRHPDPRPRSVRRTAATAIALAALAGGLAFLPGSAQAAPGKESVARRIDQLNERVDVATEDYNEARIVLAAAEKRTKSLNAKARAQTRATEQLRRSVAAIAVAAYTGGGDDLATVVTSRSPQDAVDRATSLTELSDHNQARIVAFRTAGRILATKRHEAARSLQQQRRVEHRMAAKKTVIVRALSEQKQLLARIEAAERAAAAKRRAEARREAAQKREAADRAEHRQHGGQDNGNGGGNGGNGGGDQGKPPSGPPPPASGRAARAIAFAKSQLGKPYQWGADGPGSYDCSGLTMRAWGAAGVGLPHSSRAQAGSGASVSRSQLQPGDLVFFGSPIHHVGLYVGGGKMIDAPHTGAVVRYSDITESYYVSEYAGAVRPG